MGTYAKYSPLIGFGALIDALQMTLAAWLSALGGTAGGAIAGCAGGAYIGDYVGAAKAGCAIGGAVLGILGTLLNASPFGMAMGAVLAYVMSVCVSLMLGTILVVVVSLATRKFNFINTVLVYIAEIFPFLNMGLPGWTWYVVRCVRAKRKEDRAKEKETVLAPTLVYESA